MLVRAGPWWSWAGSCWSVQVVVVVEWFMLVRAVRGGRKPVHAGPCWSWWSWDGSCLSVLVVVVVGWFMLVHVGRSGRGLVHALP